MKHLVYILGSSISELLYYYWLQLVHEITLHLKHLNRNKERATPYDSEICIESL